MTNAPRFRPPSLALRTAPPETRLYAQIPFGVDVLVDSRAARRILTPSSSLLTQCYASRSSRYESAWRTVNTGSNLVGARSQSRARDRKAEVSHQRTNPLGNRTPVLAFVPKVCPTRAHVRALWSTSDDDEGVGSILPIKILRILRWRDA